MSELLKEMMHYVGYEFLDKDLKREAEKEQTLMDSLKNKIFPDFDHVTDI